MEERMNTRLNCRNVLGFANHLFVALVIATIVSPLHAEETSVDTLKARMGGVYTLEEWHKDGEVFRAPQVEGRFVLLNGMIMTILHNRMQAPNQTTVVLLGRYVLDSTTFSYGYDNTSIFTETPSGTSVSHKPRWEGMRSFAANLEDGVVHLRSESGQWEFMFTAEGLTYSENGKPLRVWRRITEN
jgi:hypothetical protein